MKVRSALLPNPLSLPMVAFGFLSIRLRVKLYCHRTVWLLLENARKDSVLTDQHLCLLNSLSRHRILTFENVPEVLFSRVRAAVIVRVESAQHNGRQNRLHGGLATLALRSGRKDLPADLGQRVFIILV